MPQNVTLDHLILSDCVLKNTGWILGLVVYTGWPRFRPKQKRAISELDCIAGDDTKIRKNMEAQLRNVIYKQTGVFKLTKKFFGIMAGTSCCLLLQSCKLLISLVHLLAVQFLVCIGASIGAGIYAVHQPVCSAFS